MCFQYFSNYVGRPIFFCSEKERLCLPTEPIMQISSTIANSYTDTVLDNLHAQMVDNGLNNITLPDTTTQYSRRRLGVTWDGEIIVYNGALKGLETIHRTGDAVITISVSLGTFSIFVVVNWSTSKVTIETKEQPRFTRFGNT